MAETINTQDKHYLLFYTIAIVYLTKKYLLFTKKIKFDVREHVKIALATGRE